MSKPRLCVVIPSLGVGGTERQLLLLLNGLRDAFELHVICTTRAGEWAETAREVAQVEALGLRGGWDPRLRNALLRRFRTECPDVVLTFMFGFDYAVNAAARAAGVSVIVSGRRQCAGWKKPRHIRLQQKANQLVDAIVANCHAVAEFCAEQEGEALDRYTVIPNGIDASYFQGPVDTESVRREHGVPVGKRVVGIVGNLSPVNDHEMFVDVAQDLLARGQSVHFLIVGQGPEEERVQRWIAERGIEADVTLLTSNPEIRDVYSMLDVAVLTSRSEGFPNVVMEAMASGKPVVSSAVGGVRELISDDSLGTTISGRDPKLFADAIERYLGDSALSKPTGQRAHEAMRDNFGVDRMVSGYRDLFEELLRENSKG